MDDIKALEASVKEAEQFLEVAEKKLRDAIHRHQKRCPHPELSVFEVKTSPPWRVCVLCGYAETGWYTGYTRLQPRDYRVPSMDSDQAWKYVKGGVRSQEQVAKDKRSESFREWKRLSGAKNVC